MTTAKRNTLINFCGGMATSVILNTTVVLVDPIRTEPVLIRNFWWWSATMGLSFAVFSVLAIWDYIHLRDIYKD